MTATGLAWALTTIMAAVAPSCAHAQGAPTVGGGVPDGIPQGSPIPRILPATPPDVRPGLAPPAVAPAPSTATGTAAISSVAIDGATAYPLRQLQPLTEGLTGPAVPVARIDAARLALLNQYRGDGYVLTTVNATVDAQGRLRFTVTEGRIAEVKLDGDIGPAGTQVLRFLNHLVTDGPIDNATLERWLLLAQDVPGVTLNAVLRASASTPGALTLIAQVSHQLVSGLFTIDNRAYPQSGPQQGLLVLDLNSVTEFGEKTEVSLYRSAGNTQTFAQLTEEVFIGGSGLRLRLYGGDGWATPSGDLRAVGYHGYTQAFGIAALYPVIRTRQQTLNLGVYLDGEDNTVKTASGEDGQLLTASNDALRIGRLGADYALRDIWLGGERSAVNTIALRLSQGMPVLGGTSRNTPLPGRVGEEPGFTKYGIAASRTQTLFSPLPQASVALKGLVTGQYSPNVLPPAEKFYLGGSDFNRGFYAGQVTGDSALAATLELQLNTGISPTVFGRQFDVAAQFYVFYDWGETWESQSSDPNHMLRSFGGGVRLNLTRYTEFDLEGVSRITRTPQGTQGNVSPLKSDAVYWRVLARF